MRKPSLYLSTMRCSSSREVRPPALISPTSGMAKLPAPSRVNSPDRSSWLKTTIFTLSPDPRRYAVSASAAAAPPGAGGPGAAGGPPAGGRAPPPDAAGSGAAGGPPAGAPPPQADSPREIMRTRARARAQERIINLSSPPDSSEAAGLRRLATRLRELVAAGRSQGQAPRPGRSAADVSQLGRH